MKYKKSLLILIMAIFLVSIAGVCASDANDTTIASDDSNQMELSSGNGISEDNLQTGEENSILTQNDDETVSAESDSQTLSAGEGTYSDLRTDIANGGNLTKSYYTYTVGDGDTIQITNPMTINGNGAIIDLAGADIQAFYVKASGVTIKNLTIKNANYNGDGGAIRMASGTVENCNFINNTATGNGGAIYMFSGTVENCNFTNNTAYGGGAVHIQYDGSVTNCNFANNTASSSGGGAIYFSHEDSIHTVTNCNFANNTAYGGGGAIYYFYSNGTVTNCNFANNNAYSSSGGAIYYYKNNGIVTNCNFANNTAYSGGAITFASITEKGNVINCNFTNNTAYSSIGGAIMIGNGTVTNCIFANNTASSSGGAISSWGDLEATADTCIFKTDSDTTYQIRILPPILNVDDFTTSYASGEKLTFDLKTNSSMPVDNGNISISVYNKNNDEWFGNYSCLSGEGWTVDLPAGLYYAIYDTEYAGFQAINRTITINKVNSDLNVSDVTLDYGTSTDVVVTTQGAVGITAKINDESVTVVNNFTIPISGLNAGTYTLTVTTIADANHVAVTKTADITVNKVDSTLTVGDIVFDYKASGSCEVSFTNAKGINASVINQTNAIVNVNNNTITVSGLDAGTYTLTVTTITDANHNNVTRNATITVNTLKTQLAASAVTTTYNINKDLVITLKDANGNPVSGAEISVDLNGAKKYTTDQNGQIKVPTKGLAAKAYTAKITFNGNANYIKSTADAKVTVKKATPKLTAKKATLKAKTKTKKYAVTLKDNTGKAMKKVQITLKVKGKTYKATTNAKGKATFKIKKLTKKGTYKATVTFKGNSNYNKITKTVKIKVK